MEWLRCGAEIGTSQPQKSRWPGLPRGDGASRLWPGHYDFFADVLFDARAGVLDHLLPLGGLRDDDLAEVCRCSAHRRTAEIGDLRLHLRIGQRRLDMLVEKGDDVRRRAGL